MHCGVVLCIQKRGAVRDIDMADLTLLDSPAVRDCQSHASHFNYSLLVSMELHFCGNLMLSLHGS